MTGGRSGQGGTTTGKRVLGSCTPGVPDRTSGRPGTPAGVQDLFARYPPRARFKVQPLQAIQRAFRAGATLAENVRVNHGRRDVVMAQQLLDCANVRAALEQGGSEAVTERVT